MKTVTNYFKKIEIAKNYNQPRERYWNNEKSILVSELKFIERKLVI